MKIPKWIDAPTPEETLVLEHIETESHEYTRCVLLSMLHECRNPYQSGHTGPLSPDVVDRWQRCERACIGEPNHLGEVPNCEASAKALEQIAAKMRAR